MKMEKKKRNIDEKLRKLSQEELFMLTEQYKWEKRFLSKKGKKESLKGYG